MTKTLGILVLATLLVASVATGEKMTGSISLAKRVFMLFDVNGPLGTGFRICRPNLVLTAAHVINEHSPAEVRVVSTYFSPAKIFTPTRIERHPKADVAALFLDEKEAQRRQHWNVLISVCHQATIRASRTILLVRMFWPMDFRK